MRRRLVVARVLKSAPVAAALMVCPLAQAASVQTVFSAENALYGAGYSIGQADGWIDDRLRSAIKQYQESSPSLSATGELDSPTLDALGIPGGRSELMGGNVVADREAARRELGLTLASASRPAPEPERVRVAPEPKPEPKPKPQKVVQVSEPAPTAQNPATQVVPKPAEKPAPEPQVAKVEPKPQVPEARPEPQSEPEPTSEPIVIASNARVSDDSADAAETATAEQSQGESVEVTGAEALPPEPIETAIEQEPASSASGDQSKPKASKGNVITRMFDFLFGWMV